MLQMKKQAMVMQVENQSTINNVSSHWKVKNGGESKRQTKIGSAYWRLGKAKSCRWIRISGAGKKKS